MQEPTSIITILRFAVVLHMVTGQTSSAAAAGRSTSVSHGNFNLEGGWGYTMHSNVSGETHVGSLTLKQNGVHVSGTFSAFDKSNPAIDGRYDPATGTLTLSRDTGLDTVQTFTLRRIGGKLTGTFRNKGKYPDSGTIELRRMTL